MERSENLRNYNFQFQPPFWIDSNSTPLSAKKIKQNEQNQSQLQRNIHRNGALIIHYLNLRLSVTRFLPCM